MRQQMGSVRLLEQSRGWLMVRSLGPGTLPLGQRLTTVQTIRVQILASVRRWMGWVRLLEQSRVFRLCWRRLHPCCSRLAEQRPEAERRSK
jgi:hypothetical protein